MQPWRLLLKYSECFAVFQNLKNLGSNSAVSRGTLVDKHWYRGVLWTFYQQRYILQYRLKHDSRTVVVCCHISFLFLTLTTSPRHFPGFTNWRSGDVSVTALQSLGRYETEVVNGWRATHKYQSCSKLELQVPHYDVCAGHSQLFYASLLYIILNLWHTL